MNPFPDVNETASRFGDPPFPMPKITVPVFPDADFNIVDYGAAPDGTKCSKAFAKAMAAAHAAGGGRVVVPAGRWTTGPIHFRSGCDLHLEEGSIIAFTDDPTDYLPPVQTAWGGIECLNYSPLLYAFGCTNIAITGPGLIAPEMELWRKWFTRPPDHMEALRQLYEWCSTAAPVAGRDLTVLKGANVRPPLIQFNRCRNVLLDGFSILESPLWTIHLYLSSDCTVRNLRTNCTGHNNDGVDVEMSRNVLVEKCVFNQGDDGIVIKAGRNRDGWRLATPTENIEVRNCRIVRAHSLLAVGSEVSAGVRNVWVHDCEAGDCGAMFHLKTNHRRGGFIENIFGDRLHAGRVETSVVGLTTDVFYQWGAFPDHEIRYTEIRNVRLRDSSCEEARWAVRLRGDAHLPAKNIEIDGLTVSKVLEPDVVENCENVRVVKRGQVESTARGI